MNWNEEAQLDEHQVVKAPDAESSQWSHPGMRKVGSSLVKRSGKKWMQELEVDGRRVLLQILAALSLKEQREREAKK